MGAYHLTRQILPSMKEANYGHVATIASIVSHLYSTNVSSYCASKAALFALFSTLRLGISDFVDPIN